eukprot:201447_1
MYILILFISYNIHPIHSVLIWRESFNYFSFPTSVWQQSGIHVDCPLDHTGHCVNGGYKCAALHTYASSPITFQTQPNYLSTQNYYNIILKYSYNTIYLEPGQYCRVSYSTNNGALWNTLATYTSNIAPTIAYNQTFSLSSAANDNTNLQIRFYLSGPTNGAECAVDEIYLLGTPNSTPNPTKIPTYITNIPSSHTSYPTTYPSKSPTLLPTKTPSKNPTDIPTKFPTVNPTQIPTIIPTINPTKYPTIIPSKIPTISPSKYPTISPLESEQEGQIRTTENESSDGMKTNSNTIFNDGKLMLIIYIIGGLSLFICCIIICVGVWKCLKQKEQLAKIRSEIEMENKMQRIESISDGNVVGADFQKMNSGSSGSNEKSVPTHNINIALNTSELPPQPQMRSDMITTGINVDNNTKIGEDDDGLYDSGSDTNK